MASAIPAWLVAVNASSLESSFGFVSRIMHTLPQNTAWITGRRDPSEVHNPTCLSAYSIKCARKFSWMARASCTPGLQTSRQNHMFDLPETHNAVHPATVLPDTRESLHPTINPTESDVLAQPLPGLLPRKSFKRSLENSWLESLVSELVKADSVLAVENAIKKKPTLPSHHLPFTTKGKKKAGAKDQETVHERFQSSCAPVSARHMTIIIRKLDQLHQRRTALLVWDWWKCRDGAVADQRLYTQMLNLVGRGKMIPIAFTLLKEMQDIFGSNLDAAPYNALISALGRAGKADAALNLYRQMSAPEGSGKQVLCQPTVVTYGAIMMTLVKAGRLGEAGEILNEMQEAGCRPNLVVFNTLISGWGRKRHGQTEVEELVAGMKRLCLMPDEVTYTALLSAYSEWGLYPTVEALWTHAQGAGIRPDKAMYTSLITSRARQGQVVGMEAVLEDMHMRGCQVDDVTTCVVAQGYFSKGQHQKADAFVKAQKIREGFQPSAAVYNVMLRGYGKLGMMREMEGVVSRMRAQGCRFNRISFELLVTGYAEAGQSNRAEATQRDMLAAGFMVRAETGGTATDGEGRVGRGRRW